MRFLVGAFIFAFWVSSAPGHQTPENKLQFGDGQTTKPQVAAAAEGKPAAAQVTYDLLLHSSSVSQQRTALARVLATPGDYVARIRKSLQNYVRDLEKDRVAGNRAVHVAALVRHPSFIPILIKLLDDPDVLDECTYDCAPVFALSVYATFGGWRIPPSLSSNVTTVYDLRSSIDSLRSLTLDKRPLDDVVQGPWLQEHRHEIDGKTEEQLIELAGPDTASLDTRELAAYALEVSVSESKNRLEFYLLAMNDIQNDASAGYLSAIHTAAYRAELAKARGQ